jgi:hypothetical protein
MRKDKTSPMFHDNFIWDDSKAIKKRREQEAQKIVLNVAVLTKPSQEK